jgi:DNA-binding response OmpR family regulator
MNDIRRILVADDEPEVRTLVTLILEGEGYVVQTAGDGEEARNLVIETHPDLVLLDVMMPKMHGFDVLAALRADPTTSEIPVIILSARTTDADIWQGWQGGVDHYMGKPFDVDDLLDKIAGVASR